MVKSLQIIRLSAFVLALFAGVSCRSLPLREPMRFAVTIDQHDKVLLQSNIGRVILDTGAPRCLIDEDLASRLGLARLDLSASLADVTGMEVKASAVVLPKLIIPTQDPARRWEVHHLEMFVVKDFHKFLGVPALLGMDVLEHRIVDLNLQESEMSFLDRLPEGPNHVSVRLKNLGGTPGLAVRPAGEKPFYARLDTGYNGFLTVGKGVWSKVPVHESTRRQGRSSGFLRKMATTGAVASKSIVVGNLTLSACPVTLVEWEHHLVGISLLRLTRVALDWGSRQAVFSLPPKVASAVAKTRPQATTEAPAAATVSVP